MDISEAYREVARGNPGVAIPVADPSQAFEVDGSHAVLLSGVIGYYISNEVGEIIAFEPNLAYRLRFAEDDQSRP